MVAQHRDQFGDDGADVTDDGRVGVAVLADLGRVDVGVDDLGFRRERSSLPVTRSWRYPARSASRCAASAAWRPRAVPGMPGFAGGCRESAPRAASSVVTTGMPGQLGQLPGCGGLTADKRRHRHTAPACARPRSAAASRGPANCAVGVGLAGQLHPRRPAGVLAWHVLGNIDQHRARTTEGHDVEGLGQHPPMSSTSGPESCVVIGIVMQMSASWKRRCRSAPARPTGDSDRGIHLRRPAGVTRLVAPGPIRRHAHPPGR